MSKSVDVVEFGASEKIKSFCSLVIALFMTAYGTVNAFDVNLRFMNFKIATIVTCSVLGFFMMVYFLSLLWQYFTKHDEKMGVKNEKIKEFFQTGINKIEKLIDRKINWNKTHMFLKKIGQEKSIVFFEIILGAVVLSVHLIIWLTIGEKSITVASIGIDEYTKMRLLQSLLIILTPTQALLTLDYLRQIYVIYIGTDEKSTKKGSENYEVQEGGFDIIY